MTQLVHFADIHRLLYGLSFPMSEEAQRDDFVIPVRSPTSIPQPEEKLTDDPSSEKPRSSAPGRTSPS
jgi:hypothetical protein